jgi:outer membrane protein assembly factor BamB
MMHLTDVHPLRLASIAVAVALCLIPATAGAQATDRIDLPAGWQPEGITTDGTSLFVGSLANGAIWKGDPATGEGSVLVPGADGTVAVGLDLADGRLWVAGGDTGTVTAYDAATGELLASYPFEAGFINDVVATETAVYATDSFGPQLLVVQLGEGGALPEPSSTTLPLSGDYEHQDGFNLNGIVSSPDGLVVIQSGTGSLFLVEPTTGATTTIDTGGADLTAGDGLELSGSTLYVVRNQLSEIAKLELADGLASASLVATLTSPDLDVPTTTALVGSDLWAVNARFGTDPTAETPYWITRLDA